MRGGGFPFNPSRNAVGDFEADHPTALEETLVHNLHFRKKYWKSSQETETTKIKLISNLNALFSLPQARKILDGWSYRNWQKIDQSSTGDREGLSAIKEMMSSKQLCSKTMFRSAVSLNSLSRTQFLRQSLIFFLFSRSGKRKGKKNELIKNNAIS